MNRAISVYLLIAFASLIGSCGAKTGLEITPYRDLSAGPFPRPIAPMSLGDVTLLRPTLRWELPAVFDGAEVDLCLDRQCTRFIESLRVLGTSARPSMDLPARTVVFWRLRGTSGTTTDLANSPTWLFHVPAKDNSGGVDTSYNAHLDLNGDGFDDVVVGAPLANPNGRRRVGAVSVFYGSSTGIAQTASLILEGTRPSDVFGWSVAGAGDVNGDGFGELVVGAPNHVFDATVLSVAHAKLYHGSPVGISREPTTVLRAQMDWRGFGIPVAGAGDVNGDGYADVLVANSGQGGGPVGTVRVFHGAKNGIETTPARTLEGGGTANNFGTSSARQS